MVLCWKSSWCNVALVSVLFQTVTGVPHADDVNSYWLVKGPSGSDSCQRGWDSSSTPHATHAHSTNICLSEEPQILYMYELTFAHTHTQYSSRVWLCPETTARPDEKVSSQSQIQISPIRYTHTLTHTHTHVHTHTHTHVHTHTHTQTLQQHASSEKIHLAFFLRLPGNQEVSAFGGDEHSDTGDNWEVECASSNAQFWQRDDNVRLRHVDTEAWVIETTYMINWKWKCFSFLCCYAWLCVCVGRFSNRKLFLLCVRSVGKTYDCV